jgi:spore coat protein U-like protein
MALTPQISEAATATTSFTVTATVAATCIVAASNLAFGSVTGVQATANSVVTVTCTNGTGYNIGLSAGSATGATVSNRSMTGPGAATLKYGLFQDAAFGTNWGNTAGTDTVTGVGTGIGQPITVFGKVPTGQFPTAGAYSDTITVTVTY